MNRTVTLRPGVRGTKRVVQQFGDQLMYVRYRYDWEAKKCYKTAEIVLSERPWNPVIRPETKVYIRVAYGEVETRKLLRQAGGKWKRDQRLWEVRYDQVARLGLESRIVK